MALRDTLRAATAQSDADARFETEKPELIERWRASIVTLHGNISNFLQEYIAEDNLVVELEDIEMREELL